MEQVEIRVGQEFKVMWSNGHGYDVYKAVDVVKGPLHEFVHVRAVEYPNTPEV